MAVTTTLTQLLQVLDRECGLHDQLRTILRAEQQVLVNADAAGLEAKVREQEFLIEEIRRLEASRLGLMAHLSRQLGIPIDDLTLERVIELSEPEQASALQLVRDRLRSVVHDVRRMNELNRHLVENGLRFVEENIAVLFGVGEEGLFYRQPRKAKRPSEVRRLIDRKA